MANISYMNVFAKNANNARLEKGLSIKALADACGTYRPNMSDILHGKNSPTLKTMQKMSEVLQVPLHELLTPENQKIMS